MITYTKSDLLDIFRDQINDTHEEVVICGITFSPYYIIEQLDPIAFDVYFNDFCSNFGYEEQEDGTFICTEE